MEYEKKRECRSLYNIHTIQIDILAFNGYTAIHNHTLVFRLFEHINDKYRLAERDFGQQIHGFCKACDEKNSQSITP